MDAFAERTQPVPVPASPHTTAADVSALTSAHAADQYLPGTATMIHGIYTSQFSPSPPPPFLNLFPLCLTPLSPLLSTSPLTPFPALSLSLTPSSLSLPSSPIPSLPPRRCVPPSFDRVTFACGGQTNSHTYTPVVFLKFPPARTDAHFHVTLYATLEQ